MEEKEKVNSAKNKVGKIKMARKLTLVQKGHLLSAQNSQKALDGNLLNGIMWNYKVKVVGYGLKLFIHFIKLTTGRVGYWLLWDLLALKDDILVTMEEED